MDLAHCSYLVFSNVCNNCMKENDGKVECLGSECEIIKKENDDT